MRGPAVIEERESTCCVGPDCVFNVDEHFNLVIEIDYARVHRALSVDVEISTAG
jgi:hypothetical protein